MEKREELIYSLIFSDRTTYMIDLGEYVDDIYRYDDFVEEIRLILKKSKVSILKSSVKVTMTTATWELKLKK
jgi:hypothetical protein